MPGMGIKSLISLMVVFRMKNFVVATDGGKVGKLVESASHSNGK
jgi:hypothetical protein